MMDQLMAYYREQCFLFSKACLFRSSKLRETQHNTDLGGKGAVYNEFQFQLLQQRKKTQLFTFSHLLQGLPCRRPPWVHRSLASVCLARVESSFIIGVL